MAGYDQVTAVVAGVSPAMASDPAAVEATRLAVGRLYPAIAAEAEQSGWLTTLNALSTLTLNLHLHFGGTEQTERVVRQMVDDIPDAVAALAIKRAEQEAGGLGRA